MTYLIAFDIFDCNWYEDFFMHTLSTAHLAWTEVLQNQVFNAISVLRDLYHSLKLHCLLMAWEKPQLHHGYIQFLIQIKGKKGSKNNVIQYEKNRNRNRASMYHPPAFLTALSQLLLVFKLLRDRTIYVAKEKKHPDCKCCVLWNA